MTARVNYHSRRIIGPDTVTIVVPLQYRQNT